MRVYGKIWTRTFLCQQQREVYMINKALVAHELGHAISATVQDAFWVPSSIEFIKNDSEQAACYCDKLEMRKSGMKGPHSRTKHIMNLGGIFGELLWCGSWSPWGARADIDDFITANYRSKSDLKFELDSWMFIDDDKLSFRACSKRDENVERVEFELDHHDTCRRLPQLWDAYLDYCDKIDKGAFMETIDEISKANEEIIQGKKLKEIIGGIING